MLVILQLNAPWLGDQCSRTYRDPGAYPAVEFDFITYYSRYLLGRGLTKGPLGCCGFKSHGRILKRANQCGKHLMCLSQLVTSRECNQIRLLWGICVVLLCKYGPYFIEQDQSTAEIYAGLAMAQTEDCCLPISCCRWCCGNAVHDPSSNWDTNVWF